MYNMDDIRERVILVGVDTEGGETAERSLDELAELAATAGAEVTGRLIQTRAFLRDFSRLLTLGKRRF